MRVKKSLKSCVWCKIVPIFMQLSCIDLFNNTFWNLFFGTRIAQNSPRNFFLINQKFRKAKMCIYIISFKF